MVAQVKMKWESPKVLRQLQLRPIAASAASGGVSTQRTRDPQLYLFTFHTPRAPILSFTSQLSDSAQLSPYTGVPCRSHPSVGVRRLFSAAQLHWWHAGLNYSVGGFICLSISTTSGPSDSGTRNAGLDTFREDASQAQGD